VRTVVTTHATKKGYTARNADGIYIIVEIGIAEIWNLRTSLMISSMISST